DGGDLVPRPAWAGGGHRGGSTYGRQGGALPDSRPPRRRNDRRSARGFCWRSPGSGPGPDAVQRGSVSLRVATVLLGPDRRGVPGAALEARDRRIPRPHGGAIQLLDVDPRVRDREPRRARLRRGLDGVGVDGLRTRLWHHRR